MNSWFLVKVKYTKQLDDGTFKRVTEPYLLAAISFTDAETRIYEEMGMAIKGEFAVTNIARANFNDIFQYDDSETWYKCKITAEMVSVDGDKAKKASQNFLISANSVKEAYERLRESLQTAMFDFDIVSITASPIMDVIPYNDEDLAALEEEQKARELEALEEEGLITNSNHVFSAFNDDEESTVEDTTEEE